ncbi:MAG TPA: hypothetical protein PLM16_02105, partial [Candidatus Woesebacteria bacterium]|nr:hypothetical protein [Candidatus Woesebacteria bacterium]
QASAQTEIKDEASLPESLQTSDGASLPIHNPVIALSEQTGELQSSNQIDSLAIHKNNRGQAFVNYTLNPLTHLDQSPLLNPLQLTKIGFLAVILLILATLVYDSLVIGNKSTMRLVGKNLAHIILFAFVGFLVFVFKGGMIQ